VERLKVYKTLRHIWDICRKCGAQETQCCWSSHLNGVSTSRSVRRSDVAPHSMPQDSALLHKLIASFHLLFSSRSSSTFVRAYMVPVIVGTGTSTIRARDRSRVHICRGLPSAGLT
jgi:hypothetical protein